MAKKLNEYYARKLDRVIREMQTFITENYGDGKTQCYRIALRGYIEEIRQAVSYLDTSKPPTSEVKNEISKNTNTMEKR